MASIREGSTRPAASCFCNNTSSPDSHMSVVSSSDQRPVPTVDLSPPAAIDMAATNESSERYNIFSWRKKATQPQAASAAGTYTAADFNADMNALTFMERKAMEEDMHGVGDIVPEPDDFVEAKLMEMKEALDISSATEREAWDRAVFLRPTLGRDRKLHLMCLRARRFSARDAAKLLLRYFENKRKLFGDALLVKRITWEDLTESERNIVLSGGYQIILGHERTGRGIVFARVSQWDVLTDPMGLTRSMFYLYSIMEDIPEIQQKGVVFVGDLRGPWSSSPLQLVQYFSTISSVSNDAPFHVGCIHNVLDNSNIMSITQRLSSLGKRDYRLRHRFHFGSEIEVQYVLRSFGIDVSHSLDRNSEVGPCSRQGMEESIRQRQELEDQWRQRELPYQNQHSPVALFPNPGDIIMGRNKKVALTWPGNINFRQIIEQEYPRYMAAHTSKDRVYASAVSMDVMQVVQEKYGSRFLERNESAWSAIDEAEGQKKVSQAFRNLAKERARRKGGA